MTSHVRTLLGKILITVLVIQSLTGFSPVIMTVHAQKRVIVVNAEQPNLWTLEQAHYLLAQMHRRNLDLKAKNLEELDPNEIAGLRFDVMRMLVEFGATFNQADLESNRLLSDNRTFNSERRQKLMDDRSRLSDESVRLSSGIKDLEIEKADTEDADQKKRLDAKIAAMTSHQARVDKQIETIDAELKTLNAPSGTPTATTGGAKFDANNLPKSVFDKAFEEAAAKQISKFSDSPKLNATLRLDNFLQMQYEIISKQLSLLRDELGPGERLVFLELPQTVNVAHHESDKKWAQSWWKIAGYTRRERTSALPAPAPPAPLPPDAPRQQPIKTTQDLDSIIYGAGIPVPVSTPCASRSASFISTEAIRVSDTPASPKLEPLVINVPDLKGARVTKVTVTLNGLRHPNPDNLDLMLVGPQGQNAVIMSDVGGTNAADDLTITLDDTVPTLLPDAGPLVNNSTYKPTNVLDGSVDYSNGAPVPLGGDALSIFKGTNPKGAWKLYVMDDSGVAAGSLGGGWGLSLTTTDCSPPPSPPTQVEYKDVFFNLDNPPAAWPAGAVPPPMPVGSSMLSAYLSTDNRRLENRIVRTVDLIPRQSSLNVSDMKLRTRAGAFNFVLSTLFGFGSQLNVQRQREQFSQFVQQELYSAAFGKGAREFGWTFTPMPGTDRLMSGVRTTYAVVVVPEDATSLVLESNGCYFPRSYYPPNDFRDTTSSEWNVASRTSRNCSGGDPNGNPTKVFVVPIPSARAEGGNEFWVDKVTFQPVAKGKRVVVEIRGKNFSPQTGVLINGVALVQSIGLAQPLIRDDSAAGRATAAEFKDAEVQGQVERVNTEKIVFWFKMAPDYKGTPTITLIAPGRATDINDLPLQINDDRDTKLEDYKPKMIGNDPGPDAFRIDRVRVTRNRTTGQLTAQVSGAGFGKPSGAPPGNSSDAIAQVLINGKKETPTFWSPSLMTVVFDAPLDETIKVTLVSTENNDAKKVQTIESDAVANPAFLSVTDVEVTTYETDTEGEPATLLVKIKGTGFTDSLQALIDEKTLQVAVKSATEAVFTMPDPKAAAIVTLQDGSGQRAKIVVTRKTKRQ